MIEENPSSQCDLFHQVWATTKRVCKRASRSGAFGVLAACVFAVLVAIGVKIWKPIAPPAASGPKTSSPTVVITTFITLYGLFIGGFGVLTGFVARKDIEQRESLKAWKAAAITFLILGALTDLWRVLDSTGDLFRAATSGLHVPALKDDINDFRIYFSINVFVVIFSIGVAAWPAHRRRAAARDG
jgi:H+/Cl- antiporter ClcA